MNRHIRNQILTLLLLFLVMGSVNAQQDWKGIFFSPSANRNAAGTGPGTDHARFLIDFETLVDTLQNQGLTMIVFDAHYSTFKYTFDPALANVWYPDARGFTPAEANAMATIVRNKGMDLMVSTQVVSHQNSGVMSSAYPQYMLPEPAWQSGVTYDERVYVEHNGINYRWIQEHTSSADNEPGTGANWNDFWQDSDRHLRNPYDTNGDTILFGMIDELISAFTVDGVEPDGFHIASDEAWAWNSVLDCPTDCEGQTHGEAYATAINKAYNHIKSNHPSMEVIIWSDMLDDKWNGDWYGTHTALDLISTDIVIADWRYEKSSGFQYNPFTQMFPTVERFAQKGFRVWPSSWTDVPAAVDLIWTGNMVDIDYTVMGHLYTTWIPDLVPNLQWAFIDPSNPSLSSYVIGIAANIDSTVSLIGLQECPQTEANCGTYPDCQSCLDLDGIYGDEYRDYSCTDGVITYEVTPWPADAISHWDFENNAQDAVGNNDGTLELGATTINNPIKGNVLQLDGVDDYVLVPDDNSLDANTALTISLWMAPESIPVIFSDRQSLVSKLYTEYEINLYPNQLHSYTSNGTIDEYEETGSGTIPDDDWVQSQWYHCAWILDGFTEKFYINGRLFSLRENTKDFEGTMPGNHNLTIGQRSYGGLNFEGLMDDVMYYNRALSDAEVDYIYEQQYASTTLPIDLVSFEASLQEDKVSLTWSSSQEIDVDYFLIERSANGHLFKAMGKVYASTDEKEVHQYQFYDNNPIEGTDFYRIKTVDLDESFTYSHLVAVEYHKGENIYINPNLVNDKLTLYFDKMLTDTNFEIFDMQGKLVLAGTLISNNSKEDIDISQLIAGKYIIRIKSQKDNVLSFVKLP